MTGLAYVRDVGLLTPRDLWRVLQGDGRQVAVFATGGHYLGATMMERRSEERRAGKPTRARAGRRSWRTRQTQRGSATITWVATWSSPLPARRASRLSWCRTSGLRP